MAVILLEKREILLGRPCMFSLPLDPPSQNSLDESLSGDSIDLGLSVE